MRLVSRPTLSNRGWLVSTHTCWGVDDLLKRSHPSSFLFCKPVAYTIYYFTDLGTFVLFLLPQVFKNLVAGAGELLLFMPTEQSQVEYYHYYRASQKRVRQWVQSTSRELELEAGTDLTLPLFVGEEEEAEQGGNSSGSRHRGSRRRSSSSSSKRQIHDQVDTSRSRGPSSRSRSTRKKAKANDVRSRKPYSSDGLTTSSLLSLGLFPLIFALTPPSVATLFSATILLAGYFSVDYRVKIHKFYLLPRLIYFTSFRKRSPSLRNCNR